jgi:signal peptidase I
MSRRAWAVVATLFIAPAGAIILGQRRAALMSFAADLAALLLMFASAALFLPWLLFVAMALAVLVRVNQIIQAARLPIRPALPGFGRTLLLLFGLVLVIDLTALTIRRWLVEAFKIPAGSMIPALQVGDHIFVDKRATQPSRGDVIVFIYPREPDKDFIKRVIGVGGDTIALGDDGLMVNGRPVGRRAVGGECSYFDYDERGASWEKRSCRAFDETVDGRTWRIYQDERVSGFPSPRGPWTVPPGHYFVMGDNRDNSHDSRFWGFVPPENVKGVARWIWWSTGPEGFRTDRMGQRVQ